MSVSIKQLRAAEGNAFQLTVCAGENSIRNVVSWIYMLEDEYTVSYFNGSELVVTTGMQQAENPSWLLGLVKRLYEKRAAGLIINTGKFVFDIPREVLAFCDEHDFPLLTMPWEVRITDMTQTFCVAIINNRHESQLHDQAIRDAILRRDNEEEYREILGTYYKLEDDFTVISVYTKYIGQEDELDDHLPDNMEDYLATRIARLQRNRIEKRARIGLVRHDNLQLVIINQANPKLIPEVRDLIFEVYKEVSNTHSMYMGIGIRVKGLEELYKSYQRAITAMRMAIYQDQPVIRFEDMGLYKILFSVKDENLLYSYADEILKPMDEMGEQQYQYMELLKTYIHCNRSLEQTAQELFLHRNTVNYRIQKLKEILDNPLKTVEDLFPFQVAFAIRDMQKKTLKSS